LEGVVAGDGAFEVVAHGFGEGGDAFGGGGGGLAGFDVVDDVPWRCP
jgi:hypothetical protein